MDSSLLINNMMMMVCMGAIQPLMSTIINELVSNIKNLVIIIWRFLTKKFGTNINTIRIDHNEEQQGNIFLTNISKNSMFSNIELIFSVFFVISKVKTNVDSLKCVLGASDNIHKIPISKFKYLDFEIYYHMQQKENKDGKINVQSYLEISSKKSVDDIYDFVKQCHGEYKKSAVTDTNIYEYLQIPHKKHTAFMRYKFESSTTFDSLFFPTKNKVLSLVKKLESGKIDKLAFCLHGQPGCGRTSLVKALSNLTGKHIITVKMSYMRNDIEVKDIFNNPEIPHISMDMETISGYRNVPINKRIYLLEDLDAESDVCHKRESANNNDNKPKIKDKYELAMRRLNKKKITLSGILNALDGVIEVKGSIIVITTNHRDKLDPALLRYGRITMDIEMKPMLAQHAHQLISKYYPKYKKDFIIHDYCITPATLDAFCKQSDSLNELQELISKI